MKLSEYQDELQSEIKLRLKAISKAISKRDVDDLKQRKIIFDYLLARADQASKQKLQTFDDIIHIVSHFSGEIPDYYRLSQSFARRHFREIQQAFQALTPQERSADLRNDIIIEKSEKHANVMDASIKSYGAILKTEEFANNFLAIFIPAAIEIYDALIGIISDLDTDTTKLTGRIYSNFDIIATSLDLLRESAHQPDPDF